MIAFGNEWGWWVMPAFVVAGVGIYLWKTRAFGGKKGQPGEYLTVEEARTALNRGEGLLFADVRSESAYDASATTINGAVRLHPARPLEDARALGMAKEARIVAFCA